MDRRKVARQLLDSWPRQETKLHISLQEGSWGVEVPSVKTACPQDRCEVAHPLRLVAHRLLDDCTKHVLKLHKNILSKHTHARSSFEEHAARVPKVKTDLNFDARFESYDFFKN